MPNHLSHGIDLFAPGGLQELFELHRATFGDAQMNANGDGGDGTSSTDGEGAPAGATEDGDEPLGEAGLNALRAEREASKAAKAALKSAEERAAAAEARVAEFEAANLSDIEKATQAAATAAAEAAALKSENARLKALATHPVPSEFQDLVTGSDEETYLASAKRISELAAKAAGQATPTGVVPSSGTGGDTSTTGSLAAGRDLYNSRKK